MNLEKCELLDIKYIASPRIVIELTGDLEYSRIAIIEQILMTLAQEGHILMQLDLKNVAVIDPFGYCMLVDLRIYMENLGGRLTLINPARIFLQELKQNRLNCRFDFDRTNHNYSFSV